MSITDPTPPVTGDPGTQALMSLLRSCLIAIGAVLTAHGVTTIGGAPLQDIGGAILVLAPLIWGYVQKYQAERATKARELAAVQATAQAASVGSPLLKLSPAGAITPMQAQRIIAVHGPAGPP